MVLDNNNHALTEEPLFFDNPHKDVDFPRLMSSFCNKYLDFPNSEDFSKFPKVETLSPKETFFDVNKGVEYFDNGDIKIRMHAPGAKSVTLFLLSGKAKDNHIPMTNNGEGSFSVILSNLTPGFYYHKYIVDGNEMINSMVPIGYGCFQPINFLEVPGEDDFYYEKNVSHGTIHMNQYFSTVTGETRNCYVYTPPGYACEDTDIKYPVLYLQHGAGESEIGWLWQGKLNYILDNLLAENNCRKMIVVMNSGYAVTDKKKYPPLLGALGDVLEADCIPYIDEHYNTINTRKGRAIAGLSMGAMQAQWIAFHYSNLYSEVGLFSGGFTVKDEFADYTELLNDTKRFNELYSLLFVSYGEQEDARFLEAETTLVEYCKKGLKSQVYSTPGYHEWDVWRRCIHEFLPKLFQK